MLLVPRQLQRSGMTGNVPYYGGRFTPAQAYAASHPNRRPPGSAPPTDQAGVATGHTAMPEPSRSAADSLAALQHLQDTGVITPEEYAELRARVTT
jgi:hypothetical protein